MDQALWLILKLKAKGNENFALKLQLEENYKIVKLVILVIYIKFGYFIIKYLLNNYKVSIIK